MAAPPSPSEIDLTMDTPADQISANARSGQKPSKSTARPQVLLTSRATQGEQQQESASSANSKRPRKNNTNSQNKQQGEPPAHIRSTTVIRRVHAVVNVKREDSDDEYPGHNEVVSTKKKEESIQVAFTPAASVERQAPLQRKRLPRSKVINDEDEEEVSEGQAWASGSDDLPPMEKARLRRRSQINYREDEDDEEEDDELMMGSQVFSQVHYVAWI
jgi:hypothetical protein